MLRGAVALAADLRPAATAGAAPPGPRRGDVPDPGLRDSPSRPDRRYRAPVTGSRNWKKRWLPNQHGAWAMLVVPFVVGALTRQRATGLPLWWIPLAVLWIVGYCLFAQTVTWIKTPARRRAGLRTPILTYLAVCAASGLAILALHGLCLAVWLVGFVPLVVVALALVRNHEERSVTSGMTTVAAACLMFYVLRCGGWPPLAPGLHDGLTGLLLYGYFAGTVLHVKSLIRERNNPAAARNSVLWHAAWSAAAVVLCGPWLGTGSPWWIVFFAVALARTTAMKRLQDNGLPFRPGTLGVVEIVLSAAAIACGLT